MKFGNWEVTEKGIAWNGAGGKKFNINKNSITEILKGPGDPVPKYKWIMSATEEDWLDEDDLYDLNFAFIFAAAKSGAEFDYQVFDDTLSFQYLQLDGENDEEDEEDEDDVDDGEDNDGPEDDPDGVVESEQKWKEANTERD